MPVGVKLLLWLLEKEMIVPYSYVYYTIVYNNSNNSNKIWILFAMSAYSFDEPKFTSAREKRKEKENNKQKHQKFTMHNLPEQ